MCTFDKRSVEGLALIEQRALSEKMGSKSMQENVKVEIVTLGGVKVYIFTPTDPDDPSKEIYQGDLIFYHGGGFVLFSVERVYFNYCQTMSKKCKVRVFAVGYSLGPEFIFPKSFDECYLFGWVFCATFFF